MHAPVSTEQMLHQGECREWLATHEEGAMAPEMPILDSHHHLWPGGFPDRAEDVTNRMPKELRKTLFGIRYEPKDLVEEIKQSGHNVVATVIIETHAYYEESLPEHLQPVGETKKYGDWAKQFPGICNAIVSHCNLLLGPEKTEECVLAHRKASENFRGIRHWIAYHQDLVRFMKPGESEEFMSRKPEFRQSLGVLEKHGLTYDTWCVHTQLGEIKEIALAFPKLRIIVNHIGCPLGTESFQTPEAESAKWEQWRKDMVSLARHCPNVYVKIGGLGKFIGGFGLEHMNPAPSSAKVAQLFGPYYKFTIQTFGCSRCMFESNSPVDLMGCSYTVLWNTFKRIALDLNFTQEQVRDLFFGTARKVYSLHHLPLPPPSLYSLHLSTDGLEEIPPAPSQQQ